MRVLYLVFLVSFDNSSNSGGDISNKDSIKIKLGPAAETMAELNDKKFRDAKMRASINQKMIETGEKERLKELLRTKLIECGWRDELKAYCKEVVRTKGLEHVTVDDLVAEITPKGRELVPDEVKKDLLQRIRAFLADQAPV
ncbi:transcription and mRNA export factor ENY2-like isoform X1 [Anneissia japonica]|uniref:transcription and mRNA export factor ENY2-like isoform X1 n=2 Tax=Anneissia japonica TaxID=1529436 RepID=UPI001425B3BF|nr:transcription and mRNA export factor ENY2-like isoform X1 [Anneissia japonica]